MHRLWLDFLFALRSLRRHPGFSAVAVLTLSLGIGSTTAIFSVVNAVVLRPLPYPDSERLVRCVVGQPTEWCGSWGHLVRRPARPRGADAYAGRSRGLLSVRCDLAGRRGERRQAHGRWGDLQLLRRSRHHLRTRTDLRFRGGAARSDRGPRAGTRCMADALQRTNRHHRPVGDPGRLVAHGRRNRAARIRLPRWCPRVDQHSRPTRPEPTRALLEGSCSRQIHVPSRGRPSRSRVGGPAAGAGLPGHEHRHGCECGLASDLHPRQPASGAADSHRRRRRPAAYLLRERRQSSSCQRSLSDAGDRP